MAEAKMEMQVKLEVLGHCNSCKHWGELGDYDRELPDMAECKADIFNWQRRLVAVCCEGYSGTMLTSPDFGCVMWEGKP